MSGFLAIMWPIFALWMLPLLPIIYAGIMDALESLTESRQDRSGRQVAPSSGTPAFRANSQARQLADLSSDQRAA